MSPEEEIIRANEARQLLASPIFIEACKRVTDGLAEQRRAVPIRDTDMHTRLIISEQLWMSIQNWLEMTAQTGELAQFSIKQRKGLLSSLRG